MNTHHLLQKCCTLIEQKLGWGSSEHWQNQDFETLSALIADQTEVVLSVSTLKRVWGKVKYDSLPSVTTLNTLAVFAGYENWRAFRTAQGEQEAGEEEHGRLPAAPENGANAMEREKQMAAPNDANAGALAAPALPRTTRARRHPAIYIVPAFLAVLALAGWMYRKSASAKPEEYSFSSQPLASGIPNSVVFNYNADAAGSDSVFIQQSWDPRRRFPVPAGSRTYTSIYYYPGYFKAKLVVGNRIVKEHDLLIPSNGWLAAIDQQPVPVYFSRQEVTGSGALEIPAAVVEQRNIPLQPKVPEARYYYIGDMKGLQNDNFIFETEVKSTFGQGSAICRRASVILHCHNAVFFLPLGIPGCVGEMSMMLVDKDYRAQDADLSGFGCNMSEWVRLRVEVRDKQVQIWVNGKKVWNDAFTADAAKVVGVSYRFEGPGAVNEVKFSRLDGSPVLEDTFN